MKKRLLPVWVRYLPSKCTCQHLASSISRSTILAAVKNGVKKIQVAAYNGARTVFNEKSSYLSKPVICRASVFASVLQADSGNGVNKMCVDESSIPHPFDRGNSWFGINNTIQLGGVVFFNAQWVLGAQSDARKICKIMKFEMKRQNNEDLMLHMVESLDMNKIQSSIDNFL